MIIETVERSWNDTFNLSGRSLNYCGFKQLKLEVAGTLVCFAAQAEGGGERVNYLLAPASCIRNAEDDFDHLVMLPAEMQRRLGVPLKCGG